VSLAQGLLDPALNCAGSAPLPARNCFGIRREAADAL
jgi:hypothetical protein